jgi:hypothetical protein
MTIRYSSGLVLTGLALGCGPTPTAPSIPEVPPDHVVVVPTGETMENPQYTSWARFPVGTRVTQKTATRTGPNQTVTTSTYTLVEKSDTTVVVEMKAFTKRYDGIEIDNPPERLRSLRTVARPHGLSPPNSADSGEETITAVGKEYKTKWQKNRGRLEGERVESQVWSSAEMPGGFVKSISVINLETTTIEIVDVTIPK